MPNWRLKKETLAQFNLVVDIFLWALFDHREKLNSLLNHLLMRYIDLDVKLFLRLCVCEQADMGRLLGSATYQYYAS